MQATVDYHGAQTCGKQVARGQISIEAKNSAHSMITCTLTVYHLVVQSVRPL